ncbi:MAG: 16S rRNA (cytosine(1402)-N(4))-methyltransferase RsmH [Sphaerochaetaceae bacterium]|jgi:16S rRNA (cytosine1402-N4)-methyltransferase
MLIHHKSVLPTQLLENFKPTSTDSLMIDCTCGEGGHSELFLENFPNLKVIGIDRDKNILEKASKRLEKYGDRFKAVNSWFDAYLENYDNKAPHLILFDLGISVYHYEESLRGFSFAKDEKLDMRLDTNQTLSAETIVNTYEEKELADLIFHYSEERYSRKIARNIVNERSSNPITTTKELQEIINRSVPPNYRYGRINPATRTFQALRIEVNSELKRITPSVRKAIDLLEEGGKVAVISFHSLEDRQVKHLFKELERTRNNEDGIIKILTKKPLVPTEQEVEENRPSRSSKLRIAQKLEVNNG